ncbi:MAG: hypothetical protein JKY61_12805 [Planctomycetes bacterium]|nr:hypothetical protein [Planctomycetota bacterium]
MNNTDTRQGICPGETVEIDSIYGCEPRVVQDTEAFFTVALIVIATVGTIVGGGAVQDATGIPMLWPILAVVTAVLVLVSVVRRVSR